MSNIDLGKYIEEMAQQARTASRKMAVVPGQVKNAALEAMAQAITDSRSEILKANSQDVEDAEGADLSSAMIDRLTLNDKRIQQMVDGLREVAALRDPVGEVTGMWVRPNGLQVGRMRVPLGVIGVIYESRPNVTVDVAALCVKSGNAVVLRGGSESINSNLALARLLRDAGTRAGLPERAIQIVENTDRQAVNLLLKMDKYIDLIVPRGGAGLVKVVMENSTIPVVAHLDGVCHVYVDEESDLEMAKQICYNAKVQRPGVCNAMETMLVAESVAPKFLPEMLKTLRDARVEIRGCPLTRSVVPDIKEATEEDWSTEYLDLILSVRVVKGIDEAIEHINHYGSHHTDSIVTTIYQHGQKFLREVDSSTVLVNASTRFSDGYEFGLGAEVGISTSKLHCRGPMGVEDLTCQKFIVYGNGQIRQ